MLEIGLLRRNWNLKREEVNEQLGDFQQSGELTSKSAMKIIKSRKEISQPLDSVAAALWQYASPVSSPEEFSKRISKGN